jgi:hypothetical protein
MKVLRNRLHLTKTRKLLKDLVEKDRTIQIGRPVTDYSVNESVKEIEKLERRYIMYRNSFWIMIFATTLTLLLLIIK